MKIGALARRAGVTPRALRHYEEQGLLSPHRTSAGYRVYTDDDVTTVRRIRMMIEAGLPTRTIREFLDCLSTGRTGIEIDMCPALRRELDAIAHRLDEQERVIGRTRRALCSLGADDVGDCVGAG